ncbi:glyoxalase [Catellatospora methionotrophica]|uniref:Glyoxalase n=1 Tax=Catellatospora methionotrophica TaxID=121620 RepID=A0A8J3L5N2_9ACTN|nr:VOC family protein [Catellatospora methionotrophica]GIG14933.1 glyoxalase [Catellatospora methionotrophica]
MSTTDGSPARVGDVDMKLEVVVLPVTDVARAEQFYGRLGWRSDQTPPGSGVVQLTPHGSGCSVHFGTGLTSATPGSAKAFLIVSDIVRAREALVAAGVDVGEVFHLGPDGPITGPDPERGTYRSRAEFADPDGNTWVMQEVTDRLPGRVDPGETTYATATDLADAMRRASEAHGEHEKRIGAADPDWPTWYAAYMVAEAAGQPLPQ